MKDILVYKEFIASIHFCLEDETFFGKLEGIDDLVTFEGQSVSELKNAFHETVDDYIKLCNSTGKKMFKSYKGSFNIKISPALHKKAVEQALIKGVPLNQLVQEAIEKEVYNKH
ncbi:MAG: type II toxin-antitoxin system HicB family antitoxin [Spirochaetes bacterium]|nr:type II toxin-antitoxin system HicB family antitoxin [Spirochaetota bacterium]